MTTPLDFRKALVKAIWSCIVEASSMNVVMSGPDVNAAMDAYSAAIEAEARAPLEAEIARLKHLQSAHHRMLRVTAVTCDACKKVRAALEGGSE